MMKKLLSLICLVFSINTASAQTFEVDGLEYTVTWGRLEVNVSYCVDVIENIVIPDFVTYGGIKYEVTGIYQNAFNNCTFIKSISIPKGVNNLYYADFKGCSSLSSININEGNPNYSSIDGVLFSKNHTTLWYYPLGKTDKSYTIPDGVTYIGHNAFQGCSSLIKINLPNSVKSIGTYAFDCCSSLTSLNIPNSVTTIDYNAFSRCTSLTNINIPNSVRTIGSQAFYDCSALTNINIPDGLRTIQYATFDGCSALTSISIPNSVTTIENHAFFMCDALASIYCKAINPPSIGDRVFYNVSKSISVYVPVGTIEAYKTAYGWSDFNNFQEYDFDNESTVGINCTTADVTQNEYYDLQGRKVTKTSKGFYISKTGKKVIFK